MTSVDPSPFDQLRFRCIGPTRGGRVVAVAADPDDPATFWFGGAAGGVWKTDDAGQYWENVTDGFLTSASIGALRVAPSDGNVIYAGTGEATIRIDVTHGDGVWKSTDKGRTWRHLGLEQTRHIGEIVVHPSDSDTVYVAALGHMSKANPERGLYRSTDGGENWELVLHVSDRAGAIDVSLDPHNPRTLFASVWQTRRTFWSIDSGGPDCGLWRSDDGGTTWVDISRNKGLPEGTLGKIGVSISPARSGRVFAMVEAEGRTRGLYRSDDHGETWAHVSAKPELSWRPWYYMHVEAHPTEADTVFVLDMKAWRSIDGGATFSEFHTPHGDNHALWIDPKNPNRMIGSDDGGAWVSLNAGSSWSSIYNQPTAQFYHLDTDDQFPYLVYGSQQDNSSIAVPSRNGKGAITWGDCYSPGTAESGYVAVTPGNPDIVFVGAIGSSPGNGDALQRYDRTTDQIRLVSVWPEAADDGNGAEVRFQWTYPIMFSPQDPGTLYACGNKVFRTTDEGQSWEAISPDLTRADPDTMGVSGPLTMDTAGAEMYATIFSFVPSAHRPGTMMAGSDDGLVHVTHDDGGTWTDVTPPDLPAFSQVTMLEESPHHEGTVWMTVARHKTGDSAPYVYRTEDFGKTWDKLVDGLPENDFCRVIREDPNRAGLLYVGTELGLYVSFDAGQNWQSLQANLPVCPVYDLKVKGTDLIVATHGRSFWVLDDLTQLHQVIDDLDTSAHHLLKPRDAVRAPKDLFADFWGSEGGKNYHVTIGQNATFLIDTDDTGHKRKRVLDAGEDIDRGVRITYWLAEDSHDQASLTILDSDGNEIECFLPKDPKASEDDQPERSITTRAGMNSFQWSMHHAAGPKMTGSDFHGRPAGPLALPGRYQVRLDVGDWSATQPFDLVKDPRVDVPEEHLLEQFDLMSRIQHTLSSLVEAVNDIRAMKARITDWRDRVTLTSADAAIEALEAVERDIVQVEFTSEGDTLNHRTKLFENLNGLSPIVSSADARPTDQSLTVFEKLSGQAADLLAQLEDVKSAAVSAVEEELTAAGVGTEIGIIGA